MKSRQSYPKLALLLILALLVSAALACRLMGEPDAEIPVEEEPTPTVIEPTEVVETEPERTEIIETEPEPIEVDEDQPEPETEETTSEAPVGGIAPEEIIQIEPGAEPTIYQPGDVIAIKDQIIMVLGWEVLPEDEFYEPDPGSVYATIDLIIVNTGAARITFSSLLQTSLKTVVNGVEEEANLDFMAMALAKGGVIDGELLPGERVRGKLGYQLPQEINEILFTFEPIAFESNSVTFALGTEPGSIPPPAFIPGETPQAVYGIGESIEVNDLVLQVDQIYIQPGQQMLLPEEGYQFVIVEMQLTTHSPTPVSIPWNQINLRDTTGLAYLPDTSAMALVSFIPPTGEYSQGETLTLKLGYEVPESETEFVLLVDGDKWDAGMIRIGLSLE
jgi:hypothetical protein